MNSGEKYKRKEVSLETLREQQHKKSVGRWIFYTLVFLVLLGVFAGVCFGVLFRVETIELNGITHYATEEISELIPVTYGDNLYSFNTAELERTLKNELSYIAEVEVKRTLPSTVIVNVVEKEPVMYIKLVNEYFLLSEQLHVLDSTDIQPDPTAGLVELKTKRLSRCVVGEQLVFSDTLTLNSFSQLYSTLEARDLIGKIRSVSMESRFDIYLSYEDRINVYIGDTYNIDMKMRFLVGIMEELYDDDRGSLDLSSTKEASFRPE